MKETLHFDEIARETVRNHIPGPTQRGPARQDVKTH